MGVVESVGSHVARLLPGADPSTLRHLEWAAQTQTFCRRDILHARGIALPPFVVLDGHVMDRRVAETGQVYAALIAGPGYLGGLRSISDPTAEAFYELVALTDGTWATWDPGFVRGLAQEDGVRHRHALLGEDALGLGAPDLRVVRRLLPRRIGDRAKVAIHEERVLVDGMQVAEMKAQIARMSSPDYS